MRLLWEEASRTLSQTMSRQPKPLIEFLKKNRYGRATFLPMSSISPRGEFSPREALKEPGVIGVASELVTTAPQYQQIARFLLGRVLVVDHIDHAIAIGRKYRHSLRMVTIEGESLSPGGSMTGGAFKNNSNLLGTKERDRGTGKRRCKAEVRGCHDPEGNGRQQKQEKCTSGCHCRFSGQAPPAVYRTEYCKDEYCPAGSRKQRKSAEAMSRSTETRNRSDARCWKSVRIMSRLPGSWKAPVRMKQELESFIEEKQAELDQWKEEETKLTRELEEIRLQASSLDQKNQFDQENLNRLNSETQTLENEQKSIYESLAHSSEEMEQKKLTIQELKTGELRLRYPGAGSKAASWRNGKRRKRRETESIKNFLKKRDQLSGQIGLLDKECFRLKSQMDKLEEEQGRTYFLYVGGV